MSMTEISKRASVSLCTVSRYFNHPETVRPSIAARIKAVVDELNYHPRAVRPGPKVESRQGIRTGMITFLILLDNAPKNAKGLALVPELIESIQDSLRRRNLFLSVGTLTPSGQFPDCALPKYCDGIIFQSAPGKPEIIERFWKFRPEVPAVWAFREHIDRDNLLDHIFYDNSAVGVMAAEYLFSKNCKKVVFFNACPTHSAYKERKANFIAQCIKSGMQVEELASCDERRPAVETYRELADRFVREIQCCDGAFFGADSDMLGIYIELLKRRFNMDDFKMIGCNNNQHLLQYISPTPATIDLKIDLLADFTVNQLLRRINGVCDGPSSEIIVKPELITRS